MCNPENQENHDPGFAVVFFGDIHMRSKSLAQPSAGFSHCLPLSLNVTHKGRKALTAGAAVLAALFSVTAAGAQSLVQVPVIVT